MYVNDERKQIFCHVPKNGGTSVGEHLRNTEGWVHFHDRHPEVGPMISKGNNGHIPCSTLRNFPKYDGYETIAIARNPWARQLSIWLFWIRQMDKIMGDELGVGPFDKDNRYYYWINDWHTVLITGGFRGWIHDLSKNQGIMTGPSLHWQDPERTAPHFWFKLETQADFLSEHLGIPPLGVHNKTPHLHYTRYFDDLMVKRVRELYIEDIKRFGYEFGQ